MILKLSYIGSVFILLIILLASTNFVYADKRPLRAAIIGASQAIYNAEMSAIRSTIRQKIVIPKQNFQRPQSRSKSVKASSGPSDRNSEVTFYDIGNFPDGCTNSNQTNINKNLEQVGWENF